MEESEFKSRANNLAGDLPADGRAIDLKKQGYGPDRILQMVSTSPSHMFKNSGLDLKGYWKMTEECIKKAVFSFFYFEGIAL